MRLIDADRLLTELKTVKGYDVQFIETGISYAECLVDTSPTIDFKSKFSFSVGKLMDLCEAEEQGRLLILPCKIGETVWRVEPEHCNRAGCPYDGGRGGHWRCDFGGKDRCDPFVYSTDFTYAMIGKEFYLTREEAEAALKKEEEK